MLPSSGPHNCCRLPAHGASRRAAPPQEHRAALRPPTTQARRPARGMEAAVPGRVALSASRFASHHVAAGDRASVYRGRCPNLAAIPMAMAAAPPGKGGGVLDRPIEKIAPGRQSEFDVKKSRKMTPPYRVILHNDNYNRREYVVQVLMKVIPGMTLDNAVNIMQEAHVNGLSVVIICSQSEAEEHCTSLRGNGLRSSIEPASGGC